MEKFNSQICTTREQSKRLLDLGLNPETADMNWTIVDTDREGNEYSVEYKSIGQGKYQLLHPNWYIPAWSLHRLIKLCPETIYFEETYDDNEVYCSLHIEDKDRIVYHDYGSNVYNFDKHRNIYNNIIDCIKWLIKGGNFNKEYLK